MHVDVVESRVDEGPDGVEVPFGVGAARRGLGDVVRREHLRGLFEVSRQRQFLPQLSFDRRIGPVLIRRSLGALLVLGPAHMDLTVGGLPVAARFTERADRLGLG
jgi:hypothetical protein